MNDNIQVSSKAYCKIILHCLKFLVNDCYGILIGQKNGNNYTVTDVIPLTHDKIYSPSFIVAMNMIQKYYKDYKILGIYDNLIINQNIEDGKITDDIYYISDLIAKNMKINPLYFQIFSYDNKQEFQGYLEDIIVFKKYIYNDKTFKFIILQKESEEDFRKIKKYLENNSQDLIVDFDDHLNNTHLDWRNQFVE